MRISPSTLPKLMFNPNVNLADCPELIRLTLPSEVVINQLVLERFFKHQTSVLL